MYMIDIVHTALTVGVALIGVSAVLLADGLQAAGAHPPSRSIGKTAPSAT